jgi:hypothetical protein
MCFQPAEIPFELKLNVTETDIVVVEDTTARDTNAVILKVGNISLKFSYFWSVYMCADALLLRYCVKTENTVTFGEFSELLIAVINGAKCSTMCNV